MGGKRGMYRCGFTLVEVLIASVILAVIIVGIGFFFGYMIKQSEIMDDRTQALELSRQGIEEMRTADFETIPDGTTGPVTSDKFSRFIVVSSPFPGLSEARLVQSMVVWNSVQGPDTLSLSTVF
jgi:prepilin-type N-terminal cleavage/methylation domain-containing protein